MSLMYVPGVLLGFLGNRTFTLKHEGRAPTSMARYLAVYVCGSVFIFTSLVVFVDRLRLPKDFVILALIIVTAGMLFTLQRSWVLPPEPRVTPPSHPTSPR